jgi:hypothetical protein
VERSIRHVGKVMYFLGLVAAPIIVLATSVVGFAVVSSGDDVPEAVLWTVGITTVVGALSGVLLLLGLFKEPHRSDRTKNAWLIAFIFAAPIAMPLAYARLISPRPLSPS